MAISLLGLFTLATIPCGASPEHGVLNRQKCHAASGHAETKLSGRMWLCPLLASTFLSNIIGCHRSYFNPYMPNHAGDNIFLNCFICLFDMRARFFLSGDNGSFKSPIIIHGSFAFGIIHTNDNPMWCLSGAWGSP